MSVAILIVDDHEAAREGLAHMLRGPHINVAATSKGGDDAISKLDSSPVDVVLMDVRMPGNDGLSMLAKIQEAHPNVPVVMMSAYDNPTYIARAAALGAKDYLLKSDAKPRIEQALCDAVEGKDTADCSSLRKIQDMMCRDLKAAKLPPDLPLTPREVQVMRHVGLGLSNKEIAKSLSISVETVKEHVQNILRKVGANDRTDAAVRAVKLGLVD